MLKINKKVQLKTGTTATITEIGDVTVTVKLGNGHRRTVSKSIIEWVRTEVQDLRVGDSIENPVNGSAETILTHEVSATGGFIAYTMTGWEPKLVPATTEVWKLHRA